jgi:WD40 repeat protein
MNEKLIAFGDTHGNIVLWDVVNRAGIGPLCVPPGSTPPQMEIGEQFSVNTLAFSPDGQMLAAGLQNGTIIVWDVMTRKVIANILYNPNAARSSRPAVNSLAFSPNSHILAG